MAIGPTAKLMFWILQAHAIRTPALAGQGVSGNCAVAVGPTATLIFWILQAQAIRTPALAAQGVSGKCAALSYFPGALDRAS